jgi:hypothetical protein
MDFGNVFRCYITEVAFRKHGNEVRAQMDDDTFWMNMTDVVYYLFENTTFMNVPWTRWNTPCCSTFFFNSELILRHPRGDYEVLLERVYKIAEIGYCGMFQRRSCVDNATHITKTLAGYNFVIGGVLERSWSIILTNRSNQPWNLTAVP